MIDSRSVSVEKKTVNRGLLTSGNAWFKNKTNISFQEMHTLSALFIDKNTRQLPVMREKPDFQTGKTYFQATFSFTIPAYLYIDTVKQKRNVVDFDWLVMCTLICFGHVIKTMVRYVQEVTRPEPSSRWIMAARLREKSHLPTADWSVWERAMVPPEIVGSNLKQRRNQVGLYCSSIKNAFPDQAEHCGIYEWAARLPGQHNNRVVYVGSTCRGKRGSLRDRILEYCRNGSHKKDLINDALERGYELWVRVKISAPRRNCREDAERMENELLAEYNYAWNIRNNAVRSILPWSQHSWQTAGSWHNC